MSGSVIRFLSSLYNPWRYSSVPIEGFCGIGEICAIGVRSCFLSLGMMIAPHWFAVGAAAFAIAFWWWRHQRAREIADQWLRQHGYRVRSLRVSYWNVRPRFRMTPFRDNDWAVDFRAEVDDTRLGGTGTVRLRVWTDWLGMIDREPEVSWDRMPTEDDGGTRAPETEWADTQLAILRRAADGEHTFRPTGHDATARLEFDETVEHVLALQRRGLLTCSTPMAELKYQAQYAAISDVMVTDDGRRALERADAAARAATQL